MKYGFVLPWGDAKTVADLAKNAEQVGWNGIFIWEPIWGIDAWVTLTAAAMQTQTIRLGTMLSPLSRMRPWKLASESATLDNLSNGRIIISVGLGAVDTGFHLFGEETDRKTRANLLDEGLDILTGLWNGQPFNYTGKHYKIKETSFIVPPPPVQRPRIPIWVVGAWPRKKSMKRVLLYDGILPCVMEKGSFRRTTPKDIKAIKEYIESNRSDSTSFDIIMEGETSGDNSESENEILQEWIDAGITWWIESAWSAPNQPVRMSYTRERIQKGPPRL